MRPGFSMPFGSNASFTVSNARTMRGPNMALVELAAHQAVAVFAAVRALVFAHQREAFLGDGAHGRDVVRVLHVQHRPDMQAADRGVRVPGALGAVALEHRVQPLGVVGEILQIDRAVLDERHRLAVALHRHHDVEAGLAHRGDVGLEASIGRTHHRVRMTEVAHHLFEFVQLCRAAVRPRGRGIRRSAGCPVRRSACGRSSRGRSGCRGRDRSSCDRPVPPPRDRAATMCCAASIARRKVGNWQMPRSLRGLIGCSVSSSAAENASVPSDPTSSRARFSCPARRATGVSTSML